MKLSDRVLTISPSLTLKITAQAKELKASGKNVIGFGAGEPNFSTPGFICDAAKEAIDKGFTKYTPASGTRELKTSIAENLYKKSGLSYEADCIVVSNGAKHSLFNICQAILNPGDECILPSPYWLTYPELIKMAGGVPIYIEGKEQNEFKPTIEDFKKAITSHTKAIMLNSPSNPCGCVYTKKELEEIAKIAVENDLYVISDEIYSELVYDGNEHVSIASLGEDIKERTIVVNGMSKAYAMTGWRIGYTASNKELAKAMGSYQSHATSNPNSIAQYASVAALKGNDDFIKDMVKVFDNRRNLICSLLDKVPGLSYIRPKGAFYVMVNISGAIGKSINGQVISGSADFGEQLIKNVLVAVIPGAAFGADNYVRLSYALSEADITDGIKRISEFMDMLK
ncbi:MAG: pyridoxal phosphate-dependent aminotransferase [Eubacteriales bacterium]